MNKLTAQKEIINKLLNKKNISENTFLRLNHSISGRYKLPPQAKNELRLVYQDLIKK